MPILLRHAIRFVLVDPIKLHSTGSVAESTVMQISCLIRGPGIDSSLSVRDRTRLTNRSLEEMSHLKARRATIEKTGVNKSLGVGVMVCHYCSRCGRRFGQGGCQTCGIPFTLRSSMDGVGGNIPALPPKIVAYAKKNGIRFVHEPPRT